MITSYFFIHIYYKIVLVLIKLSGFTKGYKITILVKLESSSHILLSQRVALSNFTCGIFEAETFTLTNHYNQASFYKIQNY